MKKETFTEKMIKRTYGITGPLDEQKRQEADRMGNSCFILLFYGLLFGNLIALFLAVNYPDIMAWAYPAFLEVLLLFISTYLIIRAHKVHLTSIDTDLLTEKERKQLKHPGIRLGFSYGLGMFLLMPFIDWASGETENYFQGMLSLQNLMKLVLGAIVFGSLMNFLITRRIRQAQHEQENIED